MKKDVTGKRLPTTGSMFLMFPNLMYIQFKSHWLDTSLTKNSLAKAKIITIDCVISPTLDMPGFGLPLTSISKVFDVHTIQKSLAGHFTNHPLKHSLPKVKTITIDCLISPTPRYGRLWITSDFHF